MLLKSRRHTKKTPMLFRIVLVLIVLMMLFTGCSNNSSQDNVTAGNTSQKANSVNKKVYDEAQIFNDEIKIYQLSRDAFYAFLESPSRDTFKNSVTLNSVFATANPNFISINSYCFPIEQELIDFAGNTDKLQEYLLENGVKGTIQDMAIFDSPRMPLTQWLNIDNTNAFITIDIELEGDIEVYTYQFYSQKDFQEKYTPVSGRIIIKGKEIDCDKAIIYHDYADIPLMEVLNAMGAKTVFKYKHNIRIRFNGALYRLDLDKGTLFAVNDAEQDLLNTIVGGPVFVYRVDDELMVGNATLAFVLSSMGEDVFVNTDRENNCVNITDKS